MDNLTPEQRETMKRPGPWGFAVVSADGFLSVHTERVQAERYAASTHGVLFPLKPEIPDAAT